MEFISPAVMEKIVTPTSESGASPPFCRSLLAPPPAEAVYGVTVIEILLVARPSGSTPLLKSTIWNAALSKLLSGVPTLATEKRVSYE